MGRYETSTDGYRGHQGWKNRETWSVALTIRNDSEVYRLARQCGSYDELRGYLTDPELPYRNKFGTETPEGVAWNDSGLDTDALDELIAELSS